MFTIFTIKAGIAPSTKPVNDVDIDISDAFVQIVDVNNSDAILEKEKLHVQHSVFMTDIDEALFERDQNNKNDEDDLEPVTIIRTWHPNQVNKANDWDWSLCNRDTE